MKLNLGRDLYLKGRIGWKGLSKDEYLTNSDYKIINATALMDGYVDWNNCGFITEDRYEESPEIMLQEGDILISKDGTLGKIGYVKGLTTPCTVASGIFVLRNSIPEKLNFDYLYHVLKSNIFKDFIQRNKSLGSTILHLYQRDLENFELELPSLEHQNSISRILNAIEEKIANNNKINAELESLAKTIYDYWFLQFEFPNEEGKPYKSSGGKMVWNEELKREIPEGWNYVLLQEFEKNIITGKTPSTKNKDNFGGNIPFITIGDIRNNTFITKTEITLSEQGSKSQENKYIPEGSICVTCIATTGLVGITTKKSQTNQQINSIICQNSFNRFYLLYAIRDFFKFSSGAKSGNTFANMSKRDFENIQLIQPEESILKQFEKKIAPILMSVKNNSVESEKLSSLRDFLLPMLLNGQVGFIENE